MYVTIGINAVIGFVIPNIAWQAHLGGLLTGAAAAASIAYLGRSRGPAQPAEPSVHWVALARHPRPAGAHDAQVRPGVTPRRGGCAVIDRRSHQV